MAIEADRLRLARDGGTPARTRPEAPMFPGGMEVGDEELAALERVIRSKNLFRYYGVGDGPQEVAAFEREFAAHLGAKRALCVNAGSSALICGLIGAGVGPGDEVIVPAYTWNATPNAVLATRALPVLAEVDESLTLDPADVARKLTPRRRRAAVPGLELPRVRASGGGRARTASTARRPARTYAREPRQARRACRDAPRPHAQAPERRRRRGGDRVDRLRRDRRASRG